MTRYVRQMSTGEIVRGAMDLYRSNFRTLFFIYAIPLIITEALTFHLINDPFWRVINFVALFLAGLIAYAAIAVSISDICTGNRPNFRRAYRYILTVAPLTLLFACLLQISAVIIGSLLLIVPGLVLGAWFMFAPVVVVVERVKATVALRRSKLLGEGFYLRNYGLLFLGMVITFVVIGVFGAGIGVVSAILRHQSAGPPLSHLMSIIVGAFCYPYLYTMMILMYYDMRARKESYDSTSLTEDFSH